MFKITHLHIFALFILVHLFLFNINAAEWGDSYRILRASEHIRDFTYPEDEKRPPLYSTFLALRPANVDQIIWGRAQMLLFSILSFYVFYQILNLLFTKRTEKNLALLLFTLNPVYLYWSLRIMADIVFTFWVLLAFYILFFARRIYENSNLNYENAKEPKGMILSFMSPQKSWPLALGFIVGLSVLTRFEGYVLFGACTLGILFILGFKKNISFIIKSIKKHFISLTLYIISFILTILPWLLYRNPLNSSYFSEPAGRTYNLETLAIYLLSLTFLFGFAYACFFFIWNIRKNIEFSIKHIGFLSFIVVELLLILAWPAAIPRLFTPLIPLLILLLAPSIIRYFDSPMQPMKTKFYFVFSLLFLLGIFGVGQFYYKLQFLVLVKELFVLVVALSFLHLYFIYKKKFIPFVILLTLILGIWSFTTIYIHKDIFKVVQKANVYITKNLSGRIGYNDVSSVSDWYLNQKDKNDRVYGFYYNAVKKENRELSALRAKNIDYLLITNEHNTDTTIDLTPWPYLKEIKHFEHKINSEVFFTKVVKVEYNE